MKCAYCGTELGDSIMRKEGQNNAYSVLVMEFEPNTLGKQVEKFELCNWCYSELIYSKVNKDDN